MKSMDSSTLKIINKSFLLSIVIMFIAACSTTKSGIHYGGEDNELASNVPNYVLFNVNSATIDSSARDSLDKQAEWLKANPDVNVIIEGHCDERGTREFNLALGAKRANSVKSYLGSFGIPYSRIATISYGKERPVEQGTGPDVWQENRRAVTTIN